MNESLDNRQEHRLWTIGLMSGTSLDGIDVALVRTDGESVLELGPANGVPYDPDFRADMRTFLDRAQREGRSLVAREDAKALERRLTHLHAEAVLHVLREHKVALDQVALVGFHGQTILHRPDDGWTWQMGDGAALARALGLPVVCDFRSADVAAGGQGAPLVPLYQQALLTSRKAQDWPVVVLNIGGVSNVTWSDGQTLLAFDTGPGNALMDDFCLARTGQPFDRGGALAARGTCNQALLSRWLQDSYFAVTPPKSLDRNHFQVDGLQRLSDADGLATLAHFTAASVAAGAAHFPAPPAVWYVTGGGRHNDTLMQCLRDRLPGRVRVVETLGWRGDSLEAEAFAFLAQRSVRGLPLTVPGTTGVQKPCSGGVLHHPD